MNGLFRCSKFTFIILLIMMYVVGCSSKGHPLSEKCVFAFYYNWYGNTEFNGKEVHWEHGVIKNADYKGNADDIKGKDNLATNFYPELKNYSSTDPKIIARHMSMMAKAKIDVVVVTWWGPNDFGSPALQVLFDEATKHEMKCLFPHRTLWGVVVQRASCQLLQI